MNKTEKCRGIEVLDQGGNAVYLGQLLGIQTERRKGVVQSLQLTQAARR
jgi:hypothetical protein